MSFSDEIALWSLAFTVVTTLSMLWLAYLGLKLAAKPKIRITPQVQRSAADYSLRAGQEALFVFHLKNVGVFYARPAAIGCVLHFNFGTAFEVKSAKYGAALEKTTSQVAVGKDGCKYVTADGICLYYEDPGEDVELAVVAPRDTGLYKVWVTARCEAGGLGVHKFDVPVT